MRLLRSRLVLLTAVVAGAVVTALLLWLRGPDWRLVGDAFTAVRWEWIAAAVGFNLLSVVVRAFAWRTVIVQALPPPHPRFPLVFSAFSVGLFANALLPGRVGELARVAVLTRKLQRRRGAWASLVGSVFAHRVFDLVPALVLVVWVLFTAKIPGWAITSLEVLAAIGVVLFVLGFLFARRHHHSPLDRTAGGIRRFVMMARYGLGVLRAPLAAAVALVFQCLGWLCQLFAVWSTMRAFHIYETLPAAGLVLVLMNLATVVPLWPGNVGLVQAVVAIPLLQYGVAYARGIAFGFGLQAVEASVGIGVGLIFLAREGLSFAMLRVMPKAVQAEVPEEEQVAEERPRPRARALG